MESLTRFIGLFDYLAEVSAAFIAIAGLIATYKGFRVSGSLIAVGGTLFLLGRVVLFFFSGQSTPFTFLLINLMFPGLFLFAAGICLLVWQLPKHRSRA